MNFKLRIILNIETFLLRQYKAESSLIRSRWYQKQHFQQDQMIFD